MLVGFNVMVPNWETFAPPEDIWLLYMGIFLVLKTGVMVLLASSV